MFLECIGTNIRISTFIYLLGTPHLKIMQIGTYVKNIAKKINA